MKCMFTLQLCIAYYSELHMGPVNSMKRTTFDIDIIFKLCGERNHMAWVLGLTLCSVRNLLVANADLLSCSVSVSEMKGLVVIVSTQGKENSLVVLLLCPFP